MLQPFLHAKNTRLRFRQVLQHNFSFLFPQISITLHSNSHLNTYSICPRTASFLLHQMAFSSFLQKSFAVMTSLSGNDGSIIID